MPDTSVEAVDATLDRVPDADDEEVPALLRDARENIGRLRRHSDFDDAELDRLAERLEDYERSLDKQEEYGGSLGSAMNPDESDAA